MAISDQIIRIQEARDIIREKEKGMGIVSSTESPNLTLLAERLDGITVVDNLLYEIDGLDGQYVLEPGYYKGGTISVKGSAGDYKLASPGTNGVITPSTSAQVFDPSTYSVYGFSKFTVDKVPKNFGDITTLASFTTSDKLLSGEQVIVKTTGADNQLEAVRITGTMTDNGNVVYTLSRTQTFYAIPEGYHAGSGQVTISLEAERTATLGTSESTIQPANGKLLSTVKIPSVSTFLTDKVTATAADVLSGKKFVDKDGNQVAGTMTDNGNVSITLTTGSSFYTVPEGYHAGSGQVNVAGDFIGSNITQYDSEDGNIVLSPSNTSQAIAGGYYVPGGNTVRVLYVDEIIAEAKEDPQIITPKNDNGDVCFAKTIRVPKIPSNYIKTEDANATAADILSGKTAYVKGSKVTGTIPNQAAKTITPTKSTQTAVAANVYTTGAITVGAIPDKYQDVTTISGQLDYIGENVSFVNHNGTQVTGKAPIVEGETYQFNALVDAYFNIPNGLYIGTSTGTTDIVMIDNDYNRIYRNWEQITLSNGYTGYKVPFEFDSNDTDIISAQVKNTEFGCEITPTGIYVCDYGQNPPGRNLVVTITYSNLNGGSKVEITSDLEDALATI